MEALMRRTLHVGIGVSSVLLVLAATVSPAQAAAPKPGAACKTLGQKIVSGKLTYTCTKSGSKLIWSKGYKLPLRVITKTLPAAISGKAYRAEIAVTGGTGYHFCNLQKGSGLPPGYSLNPKTCIIKGTGEILPAGTTKRVSPPFVIIVTDSAKPKPAAIRVTTSIVTYGPPPVLTVYRQTCQVSVSCKVLVATATGGSSPYTFSNGTGFPPMGLSVWTDVDGGYLTGVARVPGLGINYQICVVDVAGRQACKTAVVDVVSAPIFVVKVVKSGDGGGIVLSTFGNIVCGPSCQGNYVTGTSLELWAAPDNGTLFMGWSGDCTGTGKCILNVNSDKAVTATFEINSTGTYTGTAIWPNQNLPGRTGCEGGPRTMTFQIVEEEGGVITGRSGIPFSGKRVGDTMTITADTGATGLRGPFVWKWDGVSITGSMPAFCRDTATQVVTGESTYTFNLKLTS